MPLFGLVGQSLTHSFSKKYFTEKFKREGIQAAYELFELKKISEFPWLLEEHPDLAGLNITIPYKEKIIPFLDDLSEAAAAIGAVNTIQFIDGGLIGHNTDIIGFEQSLRDSWQGEWPSGALVLGSGGAAKAVRYVLCELGILTIFTVSRHPKGQNQISYGDLAELEWESHRLVVNTTPLGTFPETEQKPDLPYERFSPEHLAFDLVYNPSETAFMKAAAAQGARTQHGYGMLVGQAEAAWQIWQQHR